MPLIAYSCVYNMVDWEVPLARDSAQILLGKYGLQGVGTAFGIVPASAIVLMSPTGTYRHYRSTTTVYWANVAG